MTSANPRLADYARLREAQLLFDPVDENKADQHPLRGLGEHGPFSGRLTPSIIGNPIRLGFVTIESYGTRVRDFLDCLQERQSPVAKAPYFPEYRGFEKVFGVSLSVPQGRRDAVALIPESIVREALAAPDSDRRVFALVESAIRSMHQRRTEFDVLVVYFPAFLEPVFRVKADGYDFNLHDATKAITASLGIPSQVILDRSIEYRDRCSVVWSLSVALYAKAGGIPWKLRGAPAGTAYIGMSYVIRHEGERQTILTCCSHVFDDQGHGIQFLLFTADSIAWMGRNPFLGRDDMRRLLTKTMEMYIRQAGRLPQRVVVHKTTHFTRGEREGAAEALGDLPDYELLQIQDETYWAAVKGMRGAPTPYPVDRGAVLPLSKFSYLLWTQGDVHGVAESGRSYYQEMRGIPTPLLITQHAGATPMLDSAAEILGLTKMNWNTTRLYNYSPVTIKSASKLGHIAKYMTKVSSLPYAFRLFM